MNKYENMALYTQSKLLSQNYHFQSILRVLTKRSVFHQNINTHRLILVYNFLCVAEDFCKDSQNDPV